MRQQVARRLSSLGDEIASARTELAMLRERLAERGSATADLWARALIAQTPLADREYRAGEAEVRRIEERVGEAERRLATLVADEERLAARLAAGNPVAGEES